MDAFVVLIAILFGIPSVIFCFYAIVLLYYGKLTHRTTKGYSASQVDHASYEPTVSVVIPTHNEQDVIVKRIDNLLASDYPKNKLGVIIVDDSTDSTPMIIAEYTKKYPQIELLRFNERMGYSPCLIAGCKAAQGEIVVLAEASSLMKADAVKYLISNFVDPTIGVVTGKSIILNANEKAGRSESFYLKLLDFVRTAESNMDSTIYMKGEAAAVRRDAIRDLKELETCPGTADTGIILLARKRGLRTIYDPRVQFFEYAPSAHRERIRQKVTRGANLMKVLWEFRSMFLNPTYGKFGTIILPISFLMLTIVPLMLLAGVIVLALATVISPVTYLPIWIFGIVLLAFALIFRRPAVYAILESEYSLLRGLYDTIILRKSHDKIDKVMSTRRS